MFNPLVDNLSSLTDVEVDEKISQLGKRYFQTHNPQLQQQIAVLLDMYKDEARTRRATAALRQKEENGESDLDNLINIS